MKILYNNKFNFYLLLALELSELQLLYDSKLILSLVMFSTSISEKLSELDSEFSDIFSIFFCSALPIILLFLFLLFNSKNPFKSTLLFNISLYTLSDITFINLKSTSYILSFLK